MNNKIVIKIFLLIILIIIYAITFIFYLYLRNTIRFNNVIIDQDTIRFNNVIIDQDTYNELIFSRDKCKDELVDYIAFDDVKLFNVANSNILFYSMLDGDNDKYNPYIKYKSSLNNVSIAILKDKITDELIANNHFIKLLVYNDEYYKEYDITVTTLPIMNISFDDTDENMKNIKDKEKEVFGNMFLFDNVDNKEVYSPIKIHIRGGTSLSFPKNNYKFSLIDDDGNKVNKNLLGMRNDDDWILYSPYNDQERIRNVFSSRIWYDFFANNNKYNIRAGTYYKYIELFMNGKYYGLYAMCFPIDAKQLNISDSDYLFKKEAWYEETSGYSIDDENNVLGYEYKGNREYNDYQSVLNSYFNYVNTCGNVNDLIKTTNYYNNLDFYIFNVFVQNVDGVYDAGSKNLYLVLKSNGSYFESLYIPWDLDETFGNVWFNSGKSEAVVLHWISLYGLSSSDNGAVFNNSVVGRIKTLNYDMYVNDLKSRYNYISRELTYDNLSKIIDDYEEDIFYSGAYKRDIERWPDSSYLDYINDLSVFREYIKERLYYLREFIYNL